MIDMKQNTSPLAMKKGDFDAILQLDIFEVVGIKEKDIQIEYQAKLFKLSMVLLFERTGDGGEKIDEAVINRLADEKDSEGMNTYLKKLYPNFVDDIILCSALAKEMAIAQYIGKLLVICEKQRPEDEKLLAEIKRLGHMVQSKQWKKVSRNTQLFNLIRQKLSDN